MLVLLMGCYISYENCVNQELFNQLLFRLASITELAISLVQH